MRKIVLYIAMSLDGYVADAKGGVDWIKGQNPKNSDHGSYADFIKEVDTVILGYNTYHQIVTELSPENWPYKGMKSYVLTHREVKPSKDVNFVNENAVSLINRLKKDDGKNIWICGGASTVNQLISDNAIDEFRVTIIPTLLRTGIKLFDVGTEELKLKLLDSYTSNGMIELIYIRR